jgi:hypothetical protein
MLNPAKRRMPLRHCLGQIAETVVRDRGARTTANLYVEPRALADQRSALILVASPGEESCDARFILPDRRSNEGCFVRTCSPGSPSA